MFSHRKTCIYLFSSPVLATCLAYLMPPHLIALTVFGKKYKLRHSSFCSFPYSPVSSKLLGPYIFFNSSGERVFSLAV